MEEGFFEPAFLLYGYDWDFEQGAADGDDRVGLVGGEEGGGVVGAQVRVWPLIVYASIPVSRRIQMNVAEPYPRQRQRLCLPTWIERTAKY